MNNNNKKINLTQHPHRMKAIHIKYIPIRSFNLQQLLIPLKTITYSKFTKHITIKTQNHTSNINILNQYKNINQPLYRQHQVRNKTQFISQESINVNTKKLKTEIIFEKKRKMELQLAEKKKNNKNNINDSESFQNQLLLSQKSIFQNNDLKRCRVKSALNPKQLVYNITKHCKPESLTLIEQKYKKNYCKINRLKSKLDLTTKNQGIQTSHEKIKKTLLNNQDCNSSYQKNNLTMAQSKLNQQSYEKSKYILKTNKKNYAQDAKKKIIDSLFSVRTTETKYGSNDKFIQRMQQSIILFHGSLEYPNIEKHNQRIKIKPIKLQYNQQQGQKQWYKKLQNRTTQLNQMSPYSKLYMQEEIQYQNN